MNANDLLMGSGVKSAKFPDGQYGTTVGGLIVRPPEVRQQTDFDSGKPKVFDNGDPMMHIVVQVQTELRDPADPLDDGVRAFYLKGQMQQAVRDAVKLVGGKGLEMGGYLAVTHLRDEPNSRGRGKDKKVYSAVYGLPTAQAANDALMGTPAAATPPVQQPVQQPAVAAYVAPAPPVPTGVDPAMWARMAPEQQQAVIAAMGQQPPF
jgi:hypothetical protein